MCKNKSNLVFGVNKKNFISYIIGIVVSILFICFYFIDTRNPWCIVSSSIGAGMFSAVLLAYLIDFNSEKNKTILNKQKVTFIFNDIMSRFFQLLRTLNAIFYELENLCKEKFNEDFKNISLEELIIKYIEIIDKIQILSSPILATNHNSKETKEELETQHKIALHINKNNYRLNAFHKRFEEYYNQFLMFKTNLIIDELCSQEDIQNIESFIGSISTFNNLDDEITNFGYCLKEIRTCNLLTSLNNIGFDKIRFSINKKMLVYSRKK